VLWQIKLATPPPYLSPANHRSPASRIAAGALDSDVFADLSRQTAAALLGGPTPKLNCQKEEAEELIYTRPAKTL